MWGNSLSVGYIPNQHFEVAVGTVRHLSKRAEAKRYTWAIIPCPDSHFIRDGRAFMCIPIKTALDNVHDARFEAAPTASHALTRSEAI